MNKNLEIFGVWRHKMTFHLFLLSTDDPVNMEVLDRAIFLNLNV